MLSIYLSMYYLPRVCHTLVPEIWVRLEMLFGILTCSHAFTQLNSKDNWTTRVCHQDWSADRQGNVQTHGINRWFSLLRQWICSYPATCQHMAVWIKNNRCTAVLWRSYRQKLWHWTYYSACMLFVCVEPYRLTLWRHHWHCCICSYCHNNNQLRLAPSIPWMH